MVSCGKAMVIFKVMVKTGVQCSSIVGQQWYHFSAGNGTTWAAIAKVVLLASVLVTVVGSGGASPGHRCGGGAVFAAPLITQPGGGGLATGPAPWRLP